jgi:hypothetical protein
LKKFDSKNEIYQYFSNLRFEYKYSDKKWLFKKVDFEKILFNLRNLKRVSVKEEKNILINESRVD